MTRPLYQEKWRLLPLLVCNIAAFLLLLTWLWPTTRSLWDSFDYSLFRLLNNPLEFSSSWALVWSIGSIRLVDVAVGLLMLSFLFFKNLMFSADKLRHAFIGFFVLLVLMLLVRTGMTSLTYSLGWQRASPSFQLPDVILMSELFPQWVSLGLKDTSGHSFPGDHASVVFLWALYLTFLVSGWRVWVVWFLSAVFILPRLVAGAHWGTDAFVGGLFISLVTFAWACFTPFLAKVEGWLTKKMEPFLNILGRFFPFKKFKFFNPS